jgi:hypothetical protein
VATVLSVVLGLALIFILSALHGHLLARSQVVVALRISVFTIPGVSSI